LVWSQLVNNDLPTIPQFPAGHEPKWIISYGLFWALGVGMMVATLIIGLQYWINNTYCLLLPTIPIMEGKWGTLIMIVLIICCEGVTLGLSTTINFDPIQVPPAIGILVLPGFYWNNETASWPVFYTQYPILPWLGILLFGIVIGERVYNLREKAFPSIGMLGGLMIFGFIFFRVMCFYHIFCVGTVIRGSFWSFTREPPDLAYLLWSLGLHFSLLYFINKILNLIDKKWIFPPLLVFGGSMSFFLVVHYLVILILASPFPNGVNNVAWVFLEWIVVLYIMHPFCSFYFYLKQNRSKNCIWNLL